MQNTGVLSGSLAADAKNRITGETAPIGASDVMQYAGARELPVWLALAYLASNIVLNVLNFYWFYKMIETLRKRFDPPLGTKGLHKEDEKEKVDPYVDPNVDIQKGVYADGRKTLEVEGRDNNNVRSRRRG